MARKRRLASQPDATFDKTPMRRTATAAHGVRSKELNTQKFAAGTRPMGGGQGPGVDH